jgi:hypothetical protein
MGFFWGKRLYFSSEGRHAEDFFARKKSDGFGRERTGMLTTRTPKVPEASMLNTRPPKIPEGSMITTRPPKVPDGTMITTSPPMIPEGNMLLLDH